MSVRVFERLKSIIRSELFEELRENPNSLSSKTSDRLVQELKLNLGQLIAERYQIEKTLEQFAPELGDLDRKAGKALELGREDLAKAALTQKVELQTQLRTTDKQRVSLNAKINALEDILQALSAPDHSDADLKAQLLELDHLLSQIEDPQP